MGYNDAPVDPDMIVVAKRAARHNSTQAHKDTGRYVLGRHGTNYISGRDVPPVVPHSRPTARHEGSYACRAGPLGTAGPRGLLGTGGKMRPMIRNLNPTYTEKLFHCYTSLDLLFTC